MRKLVLIGVMSAVLSVAGAAMAKEPAAPRPAAAKGIQVPAPPEGQGQVVFFRKGTIMGAAISCAVHEDGKKISSLPPGNYAVITATPGVHSYSVRSEATDTIRIEVEAGETYFAKCNIGMGVMAGRPNLSPSDQKAFEAMKLKPVKIAALPAQ